MPLYNWDLGIYVHLLISQIVLNFISTLKIFSLYFYLSQNLSIGNDNILKTCFTEILFIVIVHCCRLLSRVFFFVFVRGESSM